MKKTFLILLLLSVFYKGSFAEKSDIEEEAQIHIDSCWHYMRLSDTTESWKYCLYLFKILQQTKDNYTRGNICRTVANHYLITNNYEEAIEYYEKAVAISKNVSGEKGQILYARSMQDFGLIYYQIGDFTKAVNKFVIAANIFYKYQDIIGIADSYNRLAGVYMLMKQDKKAYEYNHKAYEYGIKVNDKFLLSAIYICYANNLSISDSLEKAKEYYLKVLEIAKEIGSKTIASDTYYNIAELVSKQEKYDEALQLFEKSYALALETGQKFYLADILCNMGTMHYYMQNYNKARHVLLKALDIAKNQKLLKEQRNCFEELSYIEHDIGNDKKAFEYLMLYLEKMDEIYNEDDQKQINNMNIRFQAQKREADIYRLTTEKKLQTEQIRKKNMLIGSFSVLILLMAFSGILLLRFFKQKQRLIEQENEIQKHKIRELENEKILLATRSLLEGEETERRRLSRDLHDGLGGLLSGIKLKLNHMKGDVILSEEHVNEFDHALELLDKSIVHLREVAHNMMPETLIKLGLKDALHDVCQTLNESQSIKIEFQHFGDTRRMEQTIEISAYRIVQELVHNAIKHSEAHLITVQLLQEPERLGIIVQDDGKGFDTKIANEGKGMGLKNIKSRVESLKGRMDIQSEPGKGTEMHIEFLL